jgi:hypothetical protein
MLKRARSFRALLAVGAPLIALLGTAVPVAASSVQSSDPATWPTCTAGPNTGSAKAPGPPTDMRIPHCRAAGPTEISDRTAPRPSTTGHMFDGAQTTTSSITGEWGNLESVVATLYSGATQFSTDWYMASDHNASSCDPNGHYIQAGWAQTSFHNSSGPQVFEYDTVRCQWEWFTQYSIGQYSLVSYAVTGSGTNWTTWIWWNNTWNQLLSAQMPWSTAPLMIQSEENYNNNSNVADPSVPTHQNTGTQLDHNLSWVNWDTSFGTSLLTDAPYCVNFYSPYTSWSVGSTC